MSFLLRDPLPFLRFLLLLTLATNQGVDLRAAEVTPCPKDRVDCAAPGKCRRYIDANGNGFCDRSQTAATPPSLTSGTTEKGEPPLVPSAPRLFLFEAAGVLVALYLISFLASRRKWFPKNRHRSAWNLVLLATFLAAGATSVLLAFETTARFPIRENLHVEEIHLYSGMLFLTLSAIHVVQHFPYFRHLLSRKAPLAPR